MQLAAGSPDLAADEARRWLDDEFAANHCKPLRASAKVLIADKEWALVGTVGPDRFAGDVTWAGRSAQATLAALGRAVVRLDLEAGAISY